MCSAIGAFMVSDFSLGVILRQCKDDTATANCGYNRSSARQASPGSTVLQFRLLRRRRASALQEMLAGATMRFVSLGRYRSAARLR